jgi:hypothetical protein
MKNLALAALIAVASSTGCTVTATTDPPPSASAVITANWSFQHFADKTARSCPIGYGTAAIYAQPWDPINNVLYGTPVIDLFNCSDMHGVTDPLVGIYQIWLQIQNSSGSQVYATSAHDYIDTNDGNATLALNMLDDAGYFFLTWDIVRQGTNAPLLCADVGSGARVETAVTLSTGGNVVSDSWPCNHYFGTTDPILAGTYTVSIDALLNGLGVGNAPVLLNNKTVSSPNGLTDLGHVLIPIP